MNKTRIKTFTVILLTIIIAIFIFDANTNSESEAFSAIEKQESLVINNTGLKLNFSGKVWGISGNHEEININLIRNNSTDSILTIYDNTFYYSNIINDSIYIYVAKANVNQENFKAPENINMSLKLLTNYDEINFYKNNFKQLKLNQFCTYK